MYGFIFAFLLSGLVCLFFLLKALFFTGGRKSQMRGGLAFLVVVASLVGYGIAADQDARDQGFLSDADRMQAKEAGFEEASAWTQARAEQEAAERAEAEVAEVAKAKTTTALDGLASYVAEVTKDLPSSFQDHGNMIPEEARLQPLAPDVLAYAHFYWMVDSIENNCRFLGQRDNIEILSPRNGVSGWVATASMLPHHPNYAEYIEIFDKFSTAVSELGESTVCPEMYRLLGPSGSLMDDALRINGLIDPEVFQRYEVRAKDGVLWSSKDFCDRRYYLDDANQPAMHELACEEAKLQDF